MTWIQPDRLRRIATALGLALIPVALFAVHLQLQREFDTWRALRASIDETIATRERLSQLVTLHLDIDPTAHPAWTGGNTKLLDTGGQVARFNKRFGGLTLGKK